MVAPALPAPALAGRDPAPAARPAPADPGARAPAPSPWVVSARFDAWFFLLSGLVVVVPWIATRYFRVDPYTILSVVAVVSNGPHLSGTWSRVYLDTRELRARPLAYVAVPLAIAAAVAYVVAKVPDAFRFTTSVILYWATWHFAAQCYGLLRIYQRKSGEAPRLGHRAESLVVFGSALTGLLYRIHFGPRSIFDVEPFTPPVPLAAVVLTACALAAGVGCVAWDQARRARAGDGVAWSRLAFLGATLLGFGIPFVVMRDGTAGFAAAACWHGIQYLGIVYHFNRQKYRGGVADARGARLIAWASQPGRQAAYVALMLGLVGLVYGATFVASKAMHWEPWRVGLTVWTSVTLAHYWVDGLIWKMRKAENRRLLAA